jgi:hypothetical protein
MAGYIIWIGGCDKEYNGRDIARLIMYFWQKGDNKRSSSNGGSPRPCSTTQHAACQPCRCRAGLPTLPTDSAGWSPSNEGRATCTATSVRHVAPLASSNDTSVWATPGSDHWWMSRHAAVHELHQ